MLQRMRTIEQAYSYVKQQDKDSALSKHAIRELIRKNELPFVKVGCKVLISLEVLEQFLKGSQTLPLEPSEIRRVDERVVRSKSN